MQITDVRVRKVTKEGKMKAVVSVTFDNEFVVHDIKVIEGDKGLFIAMPSRKSGDGEYRDIAHPISSETREKIQTVILSKYKEAFEVAMEGKSLGINKCKYIFLKDKLKEVQSSSIVTVEELIIIKKLSKMINSGFYEVINDLIQWYDNRKPQDKRIYYELQEEAIYYNVVKEDERLQ